MNVTFDNLSRINLAELQLFSCKELPEDGLIKNESLFFGTELTMAELNSN